MEKYCIVCGNEIFSRSKSYCCKQCRDKDYNHKYYERNREKVLEKNKNWNNAHKGWNKEYLKEHYYENKEYYKKYYLEHKEEFKKRNEKYSKMKNKI